MPMAVHGTALLFRVAAHRSSAQSQDPFEIEARVTAQPGFAKMKTPRIFAIFLGVEFPSCSNNSKHHHQNDHTASDSDLGAERKKIGAGLVVAIIAASAC